MPDSSSFGPGGPQQEPVSPAPIQPPGGGRREKAGREGGPSPSLEMPRLVCVSHREPFARKRVGRTVRLERTTGGLVTALDAALRRLGGTWIASGTEDTRARMPEDEEGRTYSVAQIGLSEAAFDGYYSGYANGVLWPLFHYFTGRVVCRPEDWEAYVQVNRRFAEALTTELVGEESGVVAWIHDYQLMLVPRFVRDAVPGARLGFFLHIPFPAYEVFRILPSRREILDGLLACDLLGFHSRSYQEAFVDSARRLLGARGDGDGTVEYRGRRTQTVVAPIGIDVDRQVALSSKPEVRARAEQLRRSLAGEQIVLGVDRLDYSKGILERLTGFEHLLDRHPEHRGKVVLVQVAVPSRTRVEEYRLHKRKLDETVGRINGRFGDATWTPVRYITRGLPPPELAAYYCAADVALVTSLRDGLNLVAKEYVASRIDLGGALVLSEFAGAAEELPQAYFCNPFGRESVSEALHAALVDERSEKQRRMAALSARVRANDVHGWAASLLQAIVRASAP